MLSWLLTKFSHCWLANWNPVASSSHCHDDFPLCSACCLNVQSIFLEFHLLLSDSLREAPVYFKVPGRDGLCNPNGIQDGSLWKMPFSTNFPVPFPSTHYHTCKHTHTHTCFLRQKCHRKSNLLALVYLNLLINKWQLYCFWNIEWSHAVLEIVFWYLLRTCFQFSMTLKQGHFSNNSCCFAQGFYWAPNV